MSTQSDITGLSGNDLLFAIALTYQGSPLNLATITSVTAYLKSSQTAPDTDAKTYTVGSGLTIVSSPGGTLTWLVPHGDVPGNTWYRFDVLDASSHISTAIYGRLDTTPV